MIQNFFFSFLESIKADGGAKEKKKKKKKSFPLCVLIHHYRRGKRGEDRMDKFYVVVEPPFQRFNGPEMMRTSW